MTAKLKQMKLGTSDIFSHVVIKYSHKSKCQVEKVNIQGFEHYMGKQC